MKLDNLLKKAMQIIPTEKITYKKFISNSTNDLGQKVPTYEDFENIKASVQSVSIDSMKKLELDFAKTYKMIYSLTNLNTISKNSASDLIVYNSENYQVVKKDSDWINYNGWNGVLVVRL